MSDAEGEVDPQEVANYMAVRERYWTRRYWPVIAVLAGFILSAAIGPLFGESVSTLIVAAPVLVAVLALLLSGWEAVSVRCPRCNQAYCFNLLGARFTSDRVWGLYRCTRCGFEPTRVKAPDDNTTLVN